MQLIDRDMLTSLDGWDINYLRTLFSLEGFREQYQRLDVDIYLTSAGSSSELTHMRPGLVDTYKCRV